MTDFSSGEGTSTSGEKMRGDEVKSCGNYADSLVLVTLSVREREKKQPLRFSDIWLSVKPKPTRESVNEL